MGSHDTIPLGFHKRGAGHRLFRSISCNITFSVEKESELDGGNKWTSKGVTIKDTDLRGDRVDGGGHARPWPGESNDPEALSIGRPLPGRDEKEKSQRNDNE